ncbi:unnamed protein product [Paramecium primaurelia]|uniref:Uncharacterized protein n=2 Tax=Paramecium TaxID=5884 RepID=A0A8S1VL94_9CILI|nr:unnamed protein product [Paramecium primaurelia]CAD8177313.1 unnamed protein product [Paramecium pentaurelia]
MAKQESGKNNKRDRSPVAEMKIWQEAVRKENQHLKVYEHFTINPHKLYIIQEKPNNSIMLQKHLEKTGAVQKPAFDVNQITDDSPPLEKDIIDKLNTMNRTPRQKYQFPQTSNQELGWHSVNSHSLSPSKFTYPRKLCKETNYANDYFTMNKISPYSNKFK